MSKIIEVHDLKVHFDIHAGFIKSLTSKRKETVKAVDSIDLSINKGEILSLVGESGSGKTTIGRSILQLIKHTSGEILFDGKQIETNNKTYMKHFRQHAQMIFQDPYQSINHKYMIFDIVAEPLLVNRLVTSHQESIDRVIEALEWAGLKPAKDYLYRYPHELSGGQRQRVAIASALILNPKFIVADEPVSMLDVSVRSDILRLLVDLRDNMGLSYLFITHDLSLAWLISDRIAIMYLGKIVEIASAEIVLKEALHPYTQALISVMPIPKVRKDLKRRVLKGETPNPIDLPSGCRFHPRCPLAKEICKEQAPSLNEVSNGHFVACHLS